MKILFIAPRSFNPKQMYREYPLGIGYLGTLLKQEGHDVRIFDQNVEGLEDNSLWELVAAFQPDVAGFSVITPNYPVARRQMGRLKQEHPEVRIVAGGIHATLFPEDLVADGANVVVLGEGEPVILALMAALREGQDSRGLPGLVFRDTAGALVKTGGQCQNPSLDELPFVDRSLYNLPKYTHHSMLASRGCPHHCAFCCNYTGTVRNDGVAIRWHEKVIAEMEHLREAHGAREIFFADDIFLLRKHDILEFCRVCAARDVGVKWIGQMRAGRVDARVARPCAAPDASGFILGLNPALTAFCARRRRG